MKVGVYVGDIPDTIGGGFTFQEDVLVALTDLQAPQKHSFVVFGSFKDTPLERADLDIFKFQSFRRSFIAKILGWLGTCFDCIPYLARTLHVRSRFERSLQKHRIDLVWFVMPVPFQIDFPYIATVWDIQHRQQPWFPEVSSFGRWRFREKALRPVLQRAFRILTPNHVGKDELMRFFDLPAERVREIAHPTPSFALNAVVERGHAVLRKYSLPGKYLFYPAQFWPHKNHINLIAAARLLMERDGIDLPLVFSGSDAGNLEFIKSTVAKWDMADRVHFLGFVSREDLISLYHNATALTYVTFFGPENLPPLEAFALGCPVIASAVSGAAEQYGDAALLVDPTDIEGIASAIKRLYEDPTLRQTLVERGHRRARRWTSKEYVTEVLRLVDEFEPIRRCWPFA